MKVKSKIMIAVATIFLSNLAFAAKDTPSIKLAFVNNMKYSGSAFMENSTTGDDVTGPVVERNGGTGTYSYDTTDGQQWALVGLMFAGGMGAYCIQDDGNLALNIGNYKGDTITITYTGFVDGEMQCTCTGSACDVSTTTHKKTK
jgi:hypothetical protein